MNRLGGHYLSQEELSEVAFKRIDRAVLIHSTCIVVGAENISIGAHTRIDPFVCLIAPTGTITVGRNVHIGAYSYLSGASGIEIGDYANISQGVCLYTRSDDYSGRSMTNPTVPRNLTDVDEGPLKVGDHCIIGSGSVVMPGCTLHTGAAVGALSFVKKSLEAWTIYGGVPATRIKARHRDALTLARRLDGGET